MIIDSKYQELFDSIRAEYVVDYPSLERGEAGVMIPLSEEEYNSELDRWAYNDIMVSLRELRERRDGLLVSSDWTQVPDAPVDSAAWAEYRQALRDLPDNTNDPRNPVWPTPPA